MNEHNSTPPSAAENMYYIRKKVDELVSCNADLKHEVAQIKIDMAALKERFAARAGMWGLIGGAIPVLITLGIATAVLLLKG